MAGQQRDIAIIGAGMAGLSCASALTAMGHHIVLFDKARGPGGRMSTRRFESPLGTVTADHGAQYFTARDPAFAAQVQAWEAAGVAAPWPDIAADAWVGTPTMNSVIRHMTDGQRVHWGCRIEALHRRDGQWQLTGAPDDRLFDTVILAIPSEQAVTFLAHYDFDLARSAMLARFQPCWTALFAFDAALPTSVNILRDMGAIGWAARETAKPGRSGPECWVVQASASWSAEHLESDPEMVGDHLLQSLCRALAIDALTPIARSTHRWRYAMSAGSGDGSLWNPVLRLGVCGDWLLGPRIECSWLSGQHLASAIMDQPDSMAA